MAVSCSTPMCLKIFLLVSSIVALVLHLVFPVAGGFKTVWADLTMIISIVVTAVLLLLVLLCSANLRLLDSISHFIAGLLIGSGAVCVVLEIVDYGNSSSSTGIGLACCAAFAFLSMLLHFVVVEQVC